jgi:L-asparaginase II
VLAKTGGGYCYHALPESCLGIAMKIADVGGRERYGLAGDIRVAASWLKGDARVTEDD